MSIANPNKPRSLWKSFFNPWKAYFVTGILVSIPLYVTALFLVWIDRMLRSFWPSPYNEKLYISIVSLIVLVFFIFVLGALSHSIFGRQMLALGDYFLNKIPIIRWVYSTVKQVTEAFSSGKSAFKEVVLIRYPHDKAWALAFLTADSNSFIDDPTGEDLVSVFMPTTPNPTSGFLIFVPKRDIVKTMFTVDQAFRLIISAGTIQKTELEEAEGKARNEQA